LGLKRCESVWFLPTVALELEVFSFSMRRSSNQSHWIAISYFSYIATLRFAIRKM